MQCLPASAMTVPSMRSCSPIVPNINNRGADPPRPRSQLALFRSLAVCAVTASCKPIAAAAHRRRSSEERHDRIADVLVDDPAVLAHDRSGRREQALMNPKRFIRERNRRSW